MLKINDLVGYENRKIYQDTDYLCFSIDAVLLANFVSIGSNTKRVLDIGTGFAPIPLVLTLRDIKLKIDAVEIQVELAKIALKSVKYNGLEENISIIKNDILNYYKTVEGNSYDLIVCNPPYFKIDANSKISEKKHKAIARHEIKICLEDYFKVAKKLLKNNSNFSMIHRIDRFCEVINLYQKYQIFPTRIQFIHSKKNKEAILFLIEGIKNGKTLLKIESPIIIYNQDNSETEEYRNLLEKVK